MIEIVTGDLLDSKEKYIGHQCNCLTQNSAGAAKAIFDKWPHANTYQKRGRDSEGKNAHIDSPGTIDIMGDGKDKRYVINMYAQYYPGKPKYPNSNLDGTLVRQINFHRCLLLVAKIQDLESIAFPYKIGCNLAGGDWEYYLGTITNFAKYLDPKGVKVKIYHREGDE